MKTTTLMLSSSSSRVVGTTTTVSARRTSTTTTTLRRRSITATPAAAKNTTFSRFDEEQIWKNDDDDDVFVVGIQNRFAKLPQMLTTSAVCAAAFADNAFAGTDAEELKNFLIGFWNFRTGDVTSILLYTVAPIALPYLIFSKLGEQKMEKQMAKLEEGGWIEYMTERGLNVKDLTLVQVNVFVKAAEKGALDNELVGEFVKQQQLNEKWKQSTINVEDTRAAAATRRARAQAIIEAREEREKQESS